MTRALVVKELRECAPLAALAALAAAYALSELWGVSLLPWSQRFPNEMPFVHSEFGGWMAFICGGLALLLGFKQTAWEDFKGTYFFLRHRPMERRRMLLVKMAVGLGIVAALSAAMILVHGLWASRPGNVPSPFFWSMTVPAWHLWAVLPLVYMAAFLAGVRPGRWYGSKLLPLIAVGVLAFILGAQLWPWAALVGSAALTAMAAAVALDVAATRDY